MGCLCIFLSVARKLLCAIDCRNHWTPKKWFVSLVKDIKNYRRDSSETSTASRKIFIAPGAHHWSCADSKAGASSEDANHVTELSGRLVDSYGSSPIITPQLNIEYAYSEQKSSQWMENEGWKTESGLKKMFTPPTWWVQRSTALAIFQSSSEGLISSTPSYWNGWLAGYSLVAKGFWFIIIHT